MKCSNWMNFEAIRETIKKRWENSPEDSPEYDLTDSNLIRNCIICDFGGSGTGSPVIDELAKLVDDRMVGIQRIVKALSGEPLKRACFKELKKGANNA